MAASKDSVLERRVSPRLQYTQQKPFYGTNRKRTKSEATKNVVVDSKKAKVKPSSPAKKSESETKKSGTQKVNAGAQKCERETQKLGKQKFDDAEAQDCEGEAKTLDVKERGMSLYAPAGARTDEKGKSFVARLKETLRLFNLRYLHFVQVNHSPPFVWFRFCKYIEANQYSGLLKLCFICYHQMKSVNHVHLTRTFWHSVSKAGPCALCLNLDLLLDFMQEEEKRCRKLEVSTCIYIYSLSNHLS